jgi:hypothetical protein
MTERERWIVYPLLFLALGAALRDKLSDQTRTKRIECQELIVFGEESAGRPPVPLVQIGAVPRASAESPHLGQIVVSGVVKAQGVQAEGIIANDAQVVGLQAEHVQVTNINAGNYFFRRVPFAPQPMRAIPGVSTQDWLRAQQEQAAAAHDETKTEDAKSGDTKPKDDGEEKESAKSDAKSADVAAPAAK